MIKEQIKRAWTSLVQTAIALDEADSERLERVVRDIRDRIQDIEQRLASVEARTQP